MTGQTLLNSYLKVTNSGQSILNHIIPYTAKLSRGKTFVVVHKTHYSLRCIRPMPLCTVHMQQMILGENFHDWLKSAKTVRVSPSKVLPYTVYMQEGVILIQLLLHARAGWLPHGQILGSSIKLGS